MSNLKVSKISKLTIRLLLGVFFIGTAVLKLISIDSFEIYLYSFGIVDFVTVTFCSRLLIFLELAIGTSLLLKIYFKQIWWFTVLMLLAFTMFLIYASIAKNDSNCHCFGSLVELNPMQSIAKNIIILALLFFIRNEQSNDYKPRLKKWLVTLTIAVSLIIPFVLVPIDVVYNKLFSEKENVNTVAFYESLNDSTYVDYLNSDFVQETRLMDVSEGRYLINYALGGCRHCRLGAEKLVLMLEKHEVPHDRVKFVVGGSDDAISAFISKTNTSDFDHWKIPAPKFMSITFGKFPLYVFVEDGKIIKAGDFRILDDEMIEGFLK